MACFSRNSADVVQELRLRRPAVVRAARRRRRRRRRRAGGVATLLSMSGRHAVGPTHQVPQVQVRRPPSRPQGECDVIADFGRRCVPIGREWTAFVTLSLAAALRWRSSTTDTRCRRTLNSPTWPTSSRGPRCVSLRFFFLVCPFFFASPLRCGLQKKTWFPTWLVDQILLRVVIGCSWWSVLKFLDPVSPLDGPSFSCCFSSSISSSFPHPLESTFD